MKNVQSNIGRIIAFSSLLFSCSFVPEGGQVFSDEKKTKIVAKEDYLVDYSTTSYHEDFFLANGYKNGNPFNCYWSNQAGEVKDGQLQLNLYKEGERYYGAEYRSRSSSYHYGYYATKMKVAPCSGTISSFFTYTNNPCWDEIDIEFLGKDMSIVQFNYYTNGVGNHEYVYHLGFDASLDFHEYGFEWLRDSITWYVDGIKVYQAPKDIPSHPQHIMMNLWNQIGHDEWAGKFDESKLPAQSCYLFIAYIPVNLD